MTLDTIELLFVNDVAHNHNRVHSDLNEENDDENHSKKVLPVSLWAPCGERKHPNLAERNDEFVEQLHSVCIHLLVWLATNYVHAYHQIKMANHDILNGPLV